ncbi:MAG: HD domain-containing protein [Clostridia bacterium]|nr:HD domain-containing protein [Clostridia bacterium]
MLNLPAGAAFVLQRLKQNGYQGYVVGGCVRDSLLNRQPKDWDVCTDALPEDMQRIFRGQHVIETGLKHGTLTVMYDHEPYEVTTFRVDGEYTDHRHPDEVRFVKDVAEDLARRDFTMNAMAWSPDTGLVDVFGGREDLAAGLIRCVGDAKMRFGEDALRIMRALRFASVYGFGIEAETSRAIHEMKGNLAGVAAERIRVELAKLLCGRGVGAILREYADVIFAVLPQLAPMHGFDQRTPFHAYDVWEHTVRAVESVPPTEVLRLTMLLHDSGKPAAFTMDERGVGHAYGHPVISVQIAEEILAYLRVDHATRDRVLLLVEAHDMGVTSERTQLKRRLHKLGEEALWELIEVKRADALGKGTEEAAVIEARMDAVRQALRNLLAEQPCVTLRDMAVNGRDLMAEGVTGKALGETLNWLLGEVINERLPNEREALMAAARAHRDAENA